LKTFFSDRFQIPLPPDHRFPLDKYRRLRLAIMKKQVVPERNLLVAAPATDGQIRSAHSADYQQRVVRGELSEREIRRIGFPWSPDLVERSRRSIGGTIAACSAALQEGVSVNLAGGTHHAHRDFGSGYCLLNDCAIAVRVMQAEDLAHRIVIIDCDVHQGDGTAAIFSSDPSIFTFSIHGARNFPFHKKAIDLDLALEDGTSDQEYLQTLEAGLAQTFIRFNADLAIYLAGADPYFDDRLGRLALSKVGLARRDQLVFRYCRDAGLPVAIVMAGGYARDVADTVDIHLSTVTLAAKMADSIQAKENAH
jgi:acetoin utilization deacetylase AcuC-like enzyme